MSRELKDKWIEAPSVSQKSTYRIKRRPIIAVHKTFVGCLKENDLISFEYENAKNGPVRRCGYFVKYDDSGNILVYDLSVDGPRLFNPAYIEDLEVLIENSEI